MDFCLFVGLNSNGVGSGFLRPNPHRTVDGRHENFSVPNLSRLGGLHYRVNYAVGFILLDNDLDLELGQKINRVFAPAVDFRMAFLTTKSLYLRYRHAGHTYSGDGILDLFQLERLYDRFDFFHEGTFELWPEPVVLRNIGKSFSRASAKSLANFLHENPTIF